MDKLTLAAVFSKTERAAQELALLQQNGDIGKLSSPAHTPAEFLKVVNSYFKNLAGKSFKPKDVAVYDVYNKHHFLHSVFAIKRPYGFLLVIVGGDKVIFKREGDKLSFRPAERFRVYLRKDTFALCTYARKQVLTSSVFQESLDPNGEYVDNLLVSFLKPMTLEEMERYYSEAKAKEIEKENK